MEKEIDFYSLGIKRANDEYLNSVQYAVQIEQQYGADARLQFECGMSVANARNSAKQIEDITKVACSGTKIQTADNMRNNSYFGGIGVSKQLDDCGAYIEPNYRR